MALQAINVISDAELQAQKATDTVQTQSQHKIAEAKEKATDIIADAQDKVREIIENASDRANKESHEILVTARNKALLSADELQKSAEYKQQAVNVRILELIL